MGKTIKKVLGVSKPKVAKYDPPEVKEPAPMPDMVDEKRKAAQMQARQSGGGRSSTILTDEILG